MEQLQDFLFGADGSRFTVLAEAVRYLVAGPGNAILDLFNVASPAGSEEGYLERQRDLTMPVGIAFWIAVILIYFVLRRIRLSKARLADVRRFAADASRPLTNSVSAWLHSTRDSWTGRQAWGASWRAEVVHLALYVAIPLTMESMRLLVFLMFLPFTVMGFGEKNPLFAGTLDHVSSPVCWTFVSWCKSPSAEFRDLSPAEEALCRAGQCPPPSTRMVDPFGWVWKLAWAAISLTWIGLWRRKQRLRNARPPPAA